MILILCYFVFSLYREVIRYKIVDLFFQSLLCQEFSYYFLLSFIMVIGHSSLFVTLVT